jgi:flavin reductase (DIM6/NTAB) family NADH-FMN oxidoreductase RutF
MSAETSLCVPQDAFRRALGRFATGVGLLTAFLGERPYAMTVNAFTSVSLVPPMVLVCIQKTARGHEAVVRSGAFAVNILGAHQKELAERFAGRHRHMEDPFAGIPYRLGKLGLPILEDVQSFVECRLVETFAGGDHSIFLGEVVSLGEGDRGTPLLFFRGAYYGLGEQMAV